MSKRVFVDSPPPLGSSWLGCHSFARVFFPVLCVQFYIFVYQSWNQNVFSVVDVLSIEHKQQIIIVITIFQKTNKDILTITVIMMMMIILTSIEDNSF